MIERQGIQISRQYQAVANDLMTDELSRGRPVWLKIERESMVPALIPGDEVQIASVDATKLKPGAVIAFRRQGRIVVHRLIETHPHYFLTMGDRLKICDAPVAASDVFGQVIKQRRNGLMAPLKFGGLERIQTKYSQWRNRFWWYRFDRDYRQKKITSLQLAGTPIIIMVPKSCDSLAPIDTWLPNWSGSGFAPWLLSCNMKTEIKPLPLLSMNPNYFLECKIQNHQLFVHGEKFIAQANLKNRLAKLTLLAEDSGAVENFVRVWLATLLNFEKRGFVLHASAAVQKGRATIFYGASGAGKSTMAEILLHDGWTILSDDLVAVRKIEKQWFVDGLPFHGSHPAATASPGLYPIGGIYQLKQAKKNATAPLPDSYATASLLSCTPFHLENLAAERLTLVADCVRTHPIKRFEFVPTGEVTAWL